MLMFGQCSYLWIFFFFIANIIIWFGHFSEEGNEWYEWKKESMQIIYPRIYIFQQVLCHQFFGIIFIYSSIFLGKGVKIWKFLTETELSSIFPPTLCACVCIFKSEIIISPRKKGNFFASFPTRISTFSLKLQFFCRGARS